MHVLTTFSILDTEFSQKVFYTQQYYYHFSIVNFVSETFPLEYYSDEIMIAI